MTRMVQFEQRTTLRALAYFYGHRDDLIASENEAAELAKKLSQNGLEKLRAKKKSS